MDERAWLTRYMGIGLAVLGALEWLLGRTVSRLAAAPVLQGTPRAIVEALGRVGIFLLSPSFLLAAGLYFISVLAFGATAARKGRVGATALSLYLSLFGVLALAHSLFIALQIFQAERWLNISLSIFSLLAMWCLVLYCWTQSRPGYRVCLAVTMVVAAYSCWDYYVGQQNLLEAGLRLWPDPVFVRDIGELLAVLSPLAFFASVAVPGGQWRNGRRWIAPVVLALLFAAGNIADIATDQGFTGVFATYSLGLNLVLPGALDVLPPWPLYALSLALFTYSVLTCFGHSESKGSFSNCNTGLGLLLLLFAGYALQLPYQRVIAALSLLLFVGIARPFGRSAMLSETLGDPSQAPTEQRTDPAAEALR